ncbi:TetR/AcrR family transcriptional regulator [Virgibacillus siamensis]|uniref:TetR/AcrR family transcriptional regulator n=1 Tax=Virgibacillus siamensis TaxID=480071 RepID=UPI001FECF4F4|nr:TetR family transcriptional regulator [Virgibacillus siamensis]
MLRHYTMDKKSLREIKKKATANALAEAAFELALDRGLDGFTIDDIVQRAVYSRRTFANHFSCKEEAVATAALTFKSTREAEELIEGMSENTPLLDILYHLMKMQLTANHFWKMRKLVSLTKQNPTLVPYILSAFHRLKITAQQTLSELSHGRDSDEYIHLLVGAVYGAIQPLYDGSLHVLLPGESTSESCEAATYDKYLDTIFNYLRNGFY